MEHKLPPLKVRIIILLTLTLTGFLIYFLIKNGEEQNKIEISGTIELKEIDINSRLTSRVKSILVEEGDKVKEGQVLLELNDAVTSSQKYAAEVAFNNATKNFERMKNLYKSGSITEQQYEAALLNYATAKANYSIYDDAQIKAPWEGVILKKYVEVGELVSANTPLLTLGDINEAKVTIYLPLPVLGKIKLGQSAIIKIDAFKNKIYKGVISNIANEAEFTPKNIQTKDERIKQVYAVTVKVKNENYELKPGMECDVIIDLKENKKDDNNK
jgi:HlyD family secretion protein